MQNDIHSAKQLLAPHRILTQAHIYRGICEQSLGHLREYGIKTYVLHQVSISSQGYR